MSTALISRRLCIALLATLVTLAGCSSTQNNSVGPAKVGPGAYNPQGTANTTYVYNSDIFLDVAIPVFDPGLPKDEYGNLDDDEVLLTLSIRFLRSLRLGMMLYLKRTSRRRRQEHPSGGRLHHP